MTQYIDLTKTEGCIGILAENGETIVLTGVSVNSMPLSVKQREGELYADFANKYSIHFIFDDDIPEIDFYSVPRLDIGARDNDGGFIASVSESFSLSNSICLVYISPDRKCYLLTKDILNMIMKKMKTNKSAQDQLLGGFSVMALLLNGIFNAKPP